MFLKTTKLPYYLQPFSLYDEIEFLLKLPWIILFLTHLKNGNQYIYIRGKIISKV